jgi:hypothetical protein
MDTCKRRPPVESEKVEFDRCGNAAHVLVCDDTAVVL